MTDLELEALLDDLESDRVERTASVNKTDKFAEAICSFANDMPNHRAPGYLFIGVEDDGRPAAIDVSDRLLQNLAAIRSDGNIQPLPVMSVQKRVLNGIEMAVVEVQPSDLPPVRYKGRIQIRVGPRRAIANESEERVLIERRTATARTWDARSCGEAVLEDLSLPLFSNTYRPNAVASEIIEENHRPIQSQLAALRFFDAKSGHPTNAAILLFGKDPLFFFFGAYVQFVRYAGSTQAADVEKQRKLTGDLLTIMRSLDELAQDLAGSRPVHAPNGLSEVEGFDYPPRAMHELFMNAVIHRSYESNTPIIINQFSDRIEIQSPGGLYGDLTAEQFPDATAYRNPIIAEAAKTLGFVNRFGRGIDIAQHELAKNGGPPPSFEPFANQMLVVVRRGA